MAEASGTDLLRIPPLYVRDGIPVFCAHDDYLQNYDQIATDHLDSLDADGINPFMSRDTVDDLEARTVEFALALHPKIDRILDAGVGPGSFLARVPAAEKHGVDVSIGYLQRVKEMGISPVLAKLEDLPYADNSFDMVISTDVLEHVLDFLRASIQLVRILDEGGTLVVRVPYRENLSAYLDLEDYDLVHVRNFDLPSLRVHFEKVLGLEFLGSERLQPHWRGTALGIFEDAIERSLVQEDLEALRDVPGLREFSGAYPTLAEDMDLHLAGLQASDPRRFQLVCAALSRHLTITVAFRKPVGHRFRDSLAHLVGPGQTDVPSEAAPVPGDPILAGIAGLQQRIAALEARHAEDRVANRLKALEQGLGALSRDIGASPERLPAAFTRGPGAAPRPVPKSPSTPRPLRKRLSINGVRRALGL
ncbi:MAG: methyltransferase domain-containing protein [Pseudomonadota bacterium]